MRDALAERLLAQVMSWSPEDVARERPRLQVMAAFKYDEYQQFAPGERFVESLALWLSQFRTQEERAAAYQFVMQQLIFVSSAELHHFIAMAFKDLVRPILLRETAAALGRQPWELNAAAKSAEFAAHRRRCLVLGLSDGARLDVFRRATPELSHEQMWQTYQMPPDRATSIKGELSTALGRFGSLVPSAAALFSSVLLLDDFAGSGMSFLRRDNGHPTGKLARFMNGVQDSSSPLYQLVVRDDLHVIVLLYVATARALEHVASELQALTAATGVRFTLRCVHVIPHSISLRRGEATPFGALLERYYTPEIDDEHIAVGGTNAAFGFGECGLPLVLTQNTPNNSVFLLWAQTPSTRALFPRVSRHVAGTRNEAKDTDFTGA